MVILLILQFMLGITLVYIISRRCPPAKLVDRTINFLCAVPGSVAATGAVLYQGELEPFSSALICCLLSCLILIFYVKGRSTESVRESLHPSPPK